MSALSCSTTPHGLSLPRGSTDPEEGSTEESDDETIDHTLVNLKQPRGGHSVDAPRLTRFRAVRGGVRKNT